MLNLRYLGVNICLHLYMCTYTICFYCTGDIPANPHEAYYLTLTARPNLT
jgi:hypothetical protein